MHPRRPLFTDPAGLLSVEGLPPYLGGDGAIPQDHSERGFWARITAQPDEETNVYGYVKADSGQPALGQDVDEAFPELEDGFEIRTYSGTGEANSVNAYEVTGRTDVPTDGSVVVWLEPLGAYPGYGFVYAASAAIESSAVVLATTYNITTEADYVDVGLSIVLPSAGTYLVFARVSGFLKVTALGSQNAPRISARVVDGNGSLPLADLVSNYTHVASAWVTSLGGVGTGTIVFRHVLTATDTLSRTLKIQARRDAEGSTFSSAQIVGSDTGYLETALGYLKLS